MLEGDSFDFYVFDDFVEMYEVIEVKNGQNKVWVVVGYCWFWCSKCDFQVFDIEIGGVYCWCWNFDQDGSFWIIVFNLVNEVGCIYICQGLEVDYIGVIIGLDLIVCSGCVKIDVIV